MITVVIPAYNEELGIVETINDIRDNLAKEKIKKIEFIVVDDGSIDNTVDAAKGVGATVISNPCNMGYGISLKKGIRAAKYDTIVMTDADSTYPAKDLVRLLEKFNFGFDLVVAERTGALIKVEKIKAPLRIALRWLVEFTTGREIPDPNSGYRVFSRKTMLPHLRHLSDKFSFTTTMTIAYMSSQLSVCYLPVIYQKRTGHTTVSVFKDTLQTLQYIIQTILYYNPLKIFLATSLITGFAMGMLLILGVVFDSNALSFVGGGGIILSLLICILGLNAEQLRQLVRIQGEESDEDNRSI